MTTKSNYGFSLLEVMIAMVILSVGLLALARMQAYFAQGSGDSRYLTHAVDVGLSKIEELKAANFDSISSNSSTNTDYNRPFYLNWTVTSHQYSKKIDLTVTFNDGGRNKTVNLVGIVSGIE